MFRRSVFLIFSFVFLAIFFLPGCSSNELPKSQTKKELKSQKKVKPVYYCPFCGLKVEKKSQIKRSSLVIKVENSPDARPQSGLSKACLIYEFPVEGFITRFNVIYLHGESETVGPVRSGRLPDLEILGQYQGVLVFSGASKKVMRELRASPFLLLDHGGHGNLFWRSRYRRMPHNLYTDTRKIRSYLSRNELEKRIEHQGFLFKDDTPATTPTATSLKVDFSSTCRARFVYDSKTNSYIRYQSSRVSVDALSGKKLRAKNVIFFFAKLTWSGLKDKRGSQSPDFSLTGQGRALLFIDGKVVKGKWFSRNGTPWFADEKGERLTFNRGLTWIEVIPSNGSISWSYN